ncbi:MAG: PAC2 family protein [Candidatus Woesearchaeota archaeon]
MPITIKKALKSMPKLNNPVLIEGMPGIGNVGKIVADFLIDELDAKKLFEIRSSSFPHSVFVNEDSLVEVPTVSVYYKRMSGGNARGGSSKGKGKTGSKRDLLILAGDVQPLDEESSYEFAYRMLDLMKELDCKELITLGGIGLQEVPEEPKVYCTGNEKRFVKRFSKDHGVETEVYGVVGPIIGVTGLLVGLAKEKNIDAVCLLAETHNHPLYVGMKGSQKILEILNKRFSMGVNMKEFGKEIEEVEKEMLKRTSELASASKQAKMDKLNKGEASYIG